MHWLTLRASMCTIMTYRLYQYLNILDFLLLLDLSLQLLLDFTTLLISNIGMLSLQHVNKALHKVKEE